MWMPQVLLLERYHINCLVYNPKCYFYIRQAAVQFLGDNTERFIEGNTQNSKRGYFIRMSMQETCNALIKQSVIESLNIHICIIKSLLKIWQSHHHSKNDQFDNYFYGEVFCILFRFLFWVLNTKKRSQKNYLSPQYGRVILVSGSQDMTAVN